MILDSKRVWAIVGTSYLLTTLCYLSADIDERAPLSSTSERFTRRHPELAKKRDIELYLNDDLPYLKRPFLAGDEQEEEKEKKSETKIAAKSEEPKSEKSRTAVKEKKERFAQLHPELAQRNESDLYYNAESPKVASPARVAAPAKTLTAAPEKSVEKRAVETTSSAPAQKKERFAQLHPELAQRKESELYHNAQSPKVDAPARTLAAAPEKSVEKKVIQKVSEAVAEKREKFAHRHPDLAERKESELYYNAESPKVASPARVAAPAKTLTAAPEKSVEKRAVETTSSAPAQKKERFAQLHPELAQRKESELYHNAQSPKVDAPTRTLTAAPEKSVEKKVIQKVSEAVAEKREKFAHRHPDLAERKESELYYNAESPKVASPARVAAPAKTLTAAPEKSVEKRAVETTSSAPAERKERFAHRHPDLAERKESELYYNAESPKVAAPAQTFASAEKSAEKKAVEVGHGTTAERKEKFERLHPELAKRKDRELYYYSESPKDGSMQTLAVAEKSAEKEAADAGAGERKERFEKLHPELAKRKDRELYYYSESPKAAAPMQTFVAAEKIVEKRAVERTGEKKEKFAKLHPDLAKKNESELYYNAESPKAASPAQTFVAAEKRVEKRAALSDAGASPEKKEKFAKLHPELAKKNESELYYNAESPKVATPVTRLASLDEKSSQKKVVDAPKEATAERREKFAKLHPELAKLDESELYYNAESPRSVAAETVAALPKHEHAAPAAKASGKSLAIAGSSEQFAHRHPELAELKDHELYYNVELPTFESDDRVATAPKMERPHVVAPQAEALLSVKRDPALQQTAISAPKAETTAAQMSRREEAAAEHVKTSETSVSTKPAQKSFSPALKSGDLPALIVDAGDSWTRSKEKPQVETSDERMSDAYAQTRKNVGWQKVSKTDVFATGEFLYWQARQDGLDYAISSNALPPSLGSAKINGDVKKMEFDFQPGFRLGLGTIFANLWDITFDWTRFHTRETAFKQAAPTGFLLPTKFVSFENINVFQGANRASARWHIDYDTLTLELGRAFTPIRYLALRPHMGVIAAWIRQGMAFDYDQIASPGVFLQVRDKNKFWGVGLHGGVDLRCPLGRGWSIFGDLGASLLWGPFRVRQKEDQILSSGTPFERLNLRDKEQDIVAHVQALGGLRWDRYFSNERTHLGLSVGYEFNDWFSQNRLMAFTNPQSNPNDLGNIVRKPGDLEFQGLSLGARFDF